MKTLRALLKTKFELGAAKLWKRYYHFRFSSRLWLARHRRSFFVLIMAVGIAVTLAVEPMITSGISAEDLQDTDAFASLFRSLGGGLIGAAAIAFALVMFAMQTNVEKMPHGMFKRLSSDGRLLGSYIISFVLAVIVMSLSLISDPAWMTSSLLGAFWATVVILWLFLYAYRRALFLINPVSQLGILVDDTSRNLQNWSRMADRARPLVVNSSAALQEHDGKHDLPRMLFFESNPHWSAGVKRAINHAISYSRRYSELGDYQVSAEALKAVARLNDGYIRAKGGTFFSNNPFMSTPMSRDSVLTETLEHLRQNIQIGLARGDEQQLEQNLRAMSSLAAVYFEIDYSGDRQNKTHAHLATSYLMSALTAIVPHRMVDVMMEGVRLARGNAQRIVAMEGSNEVLLVVEDLSKLAGLGIADPHYHPVTTTVIGSLASINLDLLKSRRGDISFASKRIRELISVLVEITIATPEMPGRQRHHDLFEAYYSGRSIESLQADLSNLVNALIGAAEDDEVAQTIIRNFSDWADQMYLNERDLLVKTTDAKSSLAFDIVHWINHTTTLLMALADAPACSEHTSKELKRHAAWLISGLTFIPDNAEAVSFHQNYSMTETMFEAAENAMAYDDHDIQETTQNMLFDWIIKCAKYDVGGDVLGDGLLALSTFALDENKGAELKAKIETGLSVGKVTASLSVGNTITDEKRKRAASNLQSFVDGPIRAGGLSKIRHSAMNADQERLVPLLKDVIELVNP